ncbi:class I SAM-dependent RNA methyltransferase [Iodobacter arcticus]|uniref:Class I SAM-dependent RNA methyltransferase n=1 Tax=Iodobacter arcticus TaxID=590593 RepID=A0ABW2QRM7_9NEIS
MKQVFHFFAPCPRGLEGPLVAELEALGADQIKATDGGVGFAGSWVLMYEANLQSRIASRILWRVAEKSWKTEDDLYAMARDLDWAEMFSVDCTIKVGVTAYRVPQIRSPEFVALRIKDGICDRFRLKGGKRPSVDTAEPDMRIQLYLTDRNATLYLDTSGDALFKRGYRIETGEAPMRENLAAGILALIGWTPAEALYDPMCGSATFLIEAAMIARKIAPGARREFAFQKMRLHSEEMWQEQVAAAKAAETKEIFPIYGSDVSTAAIAHAQANLDYARFDDTIHLKQLNAMDAKPPFDMPGVWISNPPYGVRLDEKEKLAALYPQWGDALKKRFSGWRAYFLTADMDITKHMGLKASKRTPLYNGGLECRLFEYIMISGGMRRKPTGSDE